MSQKSNGCIACISRRTVLAAGVGGVAAVLAGCASYGDAPPAPIAADAASPSTASSATSAASDATSGLRAAPDETAAVVSGAVPLAALADIPVGGGIILADQGIVLTQPTEGTVLAFSSTCTHAGCAVTSVDGGEIRCRCHGSAFDVTTGEPTAGPARSPLPGVAIAVSGSDVVRA